MNSTVNYGVFTPFLEDSNVKRIDYNGRDVWVTTETGKRYKPDVKISKKFEEYFTNQVKALSNTEWNIKNPVLEITVDEVKIIMLHRSVTNDNSLNIVINKRNK